MNMGLTDFHTHTFLSDGVLSPCEMIRYGVAGGYSMIALTDHVGAGTMERVLKELRTDCQLAGKAWGIKTLVGVELTHVPAQAVSSLATQAKSFGADLVIVHGETITEPVAAGTNRAAVSCSDVDILAHPGLLSTEEARLAAKNGVFLEISARRGHAYTNGHVVRVAREAGAELIINSDSHQPGDLLTEEFRRQVGFGAGLDATELEKVLSETPQKLLQKLEGKKKES
jgi:histidinol phosphatase-like PHP family hydrolase